MRRLLTFLMMITLTVVSGTSLAAAMCRHQDVQAHAAALQDSDRQVSVAAHLEDAAGNVVSKKSAVADAGAFSLPAFIMPDASALLRSDAALAIRPMPDEAEKMAGLSIRPLLHPPAL